MIINNNSKSEINFVNYSIRNSKQIIIKLKKYRNVLNHLMFLMITY